MTEQQARDLVARFPGSRRCGQCAYAAVLFAGEAGDIDDPFEQGDVVFAECRQEIDRLMPP